LLRAWNCSDMSIYDMAKDAVKVAQKADNIELVKKLMDVQQTALEMQAKQHELNNRIEELEKANAQLRDQLEEEGSFILDQAVYWRKEDEGCQQPFCPTCKAKHLLIPMTPNKQGTNVAYFHCPNCNFGTSLNGHVFATGVTHARLSAFNFDQQF
jgi:hypothetical protein